MDGVCGVPEPRQAEHTADNSEQPAVQPAERRGGDREPVKGEEECADVQEHSGAEQFDSVATATAETVCDRQPADEHDQTDRDLQEDDGVVPAAGR